MTSPRGAYQKPALSEKTCSTCQETLPVADFYVERVNPATGREILRATCRGCFNAARVKAKVAERVRLNALEASGAGTRVRVREAVPVARPAERVPSAVVASLNHMKLVDVIVGDGALLVRAKRDLDSRRESFREERGDYPFLPAYGTADGCPKGLHAFPIEVPCRGYQALDCLGLGPHIHRKCPAHSVEVIERAPTKGALVPVMVRRRA